MPTALRPRWTPPLAPRHKDAMRRAYVGGPAEDARDTIRFIDDVAKYFPVTAAALALQKWIFDWASLFGIKDQVEYAVYALRAASGVNYGAVGAGIVPASGVTSASVSTALSGAGVVGAALPIAGAVVAVVSFLSSDDDEEKQKQRLKRAQDDIQHLRERLTLAQFADEQRDSAAAARGIAMSPLLVSYSGKTAADLQAEAEVSDKLAILYDKARSELPADQAALFESISNLSRWRAVLDAYSNMSASARDNFDSVGFGTSQPRLPYQLKAPIAAEKASLDAIQSGELPSAPLGAWTKVALTFTAGAALGLYLLEPALARSLLSRAGSTLMHAPQTVRRLFT